MNKVKTITDGSQTAKPLTECNFDELTARIASLYTALSSEDFTPEQKADVLRNIATANALTVKAIKADNPEIVKVLHEQNAESSKLAKIAQEAQQAFYREVTSVENQCKLDWVIPTKDGNKEVLSTSFELLSVEGTFTAKSPNIEILGEDGEYHNKRNGGIAEFRAVPKVLPYSGKEGKSIVLFFGAVIANTEDCERLKPRAGFKLLDTTTTEGNAETFSKRPEKGAKKARQQEKTDKLQTAVTD